MPEINKMPSAEQIKSMYPNQEESEREQPQDKPLTGKEAAEKLSEISDSITKKHTEYQMNNPILASQVKKRQMKIAKL